MEIISLSRNSHAAKFDLHVAYPLPLSDPGNVRY